MKGLSIMKSSCSLAVLLLLPWQSIQAGDMKSEKPPIEQPLVREGTLALQLAESLKIGNPRSELEAEKCTGRMLELLLEMAGSWIIHDARYSCRVEDFQLVMLSIRRN